LFHTFTIAKEYLKSRLHVFFLVSTSAVHSSRAHLLEVVRMAKFYEVPLVLHAFLDGRQPAPSSAVDLLMTIEESMSGVGVIGTISGRHYAMDRDGRWDRTFKAYSAIVRGDAPRAESTLEALQQAYAAGLRDERVEPTRIGEYEGAVGTFMADFTSKQRPVPWEWFGEEVGLALNVRADRMRQLSAMFLRRDLPPQAMEWLSDRGKAVYAFQEHCYRCLSDPDPSLKLPVAFPRESVPGSLGEVIAEAGLRQLRCAESEKAAHVTWMFSGGREEPFPGEDRRIVPSPRDVETHAERPEMSAAEVAAAAAAAVREGGHDFVLVNFANPDVVAHSGDLAAAVRAVEAVDAAVGVIAEALREAGGALVITSAHGNCEEMLAAGAPHADHTRNPVPLYYVNDADPGVTLRPGGRLEDVAPTLLELLGLPQPESMTGRSLRARS
ncbi:MAG TPA: 2,3-bisphosphoglycerate-independent phosphoglycerate mutase, partial [Candidatus Nanopelagicales bacterium]|nr:2,3-bisphosphoglycerate-independent phosphoglycerate mutase [Candidatus Nanopelagicales bacterium]